MTDLRLRVCGKLCLAELETIEGINKAEAFTAITQDASLIAQSGFLISNTAQQSVVLIAGSLYLAWLSMTAFLLFVVGSAFAVWRFVDHRQSPMDAVRTPYIANADTAIQRLHLLERRIDEARAGATDLAEAPASFAGFRTIRLCDVGFSYAASASLDPFSVGPINLEIRRGEMLFIVGGNGSGKTTLLKLISGLYEPRSGTISVDDIPVTESLRPSFRSLFAGVFSDFHLFNRLYGVGTVDLATASDLLARMEISHKVKIVDGRFSTLDLSTGQRKRLALIASVLEDRHVYIFDEWTADQDPHFREEFYGKIVPELKRHGKTVIAITHDNRYWNRCDRVVKLDYGQMVSVGTNQTLEG